MYKVSGVSGLEPPFVETKLLGKVECVESVIVKSEEVAGVVVVLMIWSISREIKCYYYCQGRCALCCWCGEEITFCCGGSCWLW